MVLALEFFFDDNADDAVRHLWRKLEDVGVTSVLTMDTREHRPHITFAVGSSVSQAARDALRKQLRTLAIPNIWLSTLSIFPARDATVVLSAVVDTELLAVHSAVHDVLAGQVKDPSALYLPGAWIPHCTLARNVSSTQLGAALNAVNPVTPIQATLCEVRLIDTNTSEADVLLAR